MSPNFQRRRSLHFPRLCSALIIGRARLPQRQHGRWVRATANDKSLLHIQENMDGPGEEHVYLGAGIMGLILASVSDGLLLRDIGSIVAASSPLEGGAAVTQRESLLLPAEFTRCDQEITAAREALLTGSIPILDALLWYCDWQRERDLLLDQRRSFLDRSEYPLKIR
jgi:hypothetical protein